MKYGAVVLDADNMTCMSLISLIKQVLPEVDAYPINTMAELGGITNINKRSTDLLVTNVIVGNSYGDNLLERVKATGAWEVIFFHEDISTPSEALHALYDKGYTMLSLNAPTSIWISTLQQVLRKVAQSKQQTEENK